MSEDPSVCSKAGRLSNYINIWKSITKDKYILEAVIGFKLPFKSIPIQGSEPINPSFTASETKLVDDSIIKLLQTGAIVISEEEEGQFVSKIFTVPKPDGTRRPIINLKILNTYLKSPHFKMENIKTAATLVSLNSFMAVVDLKDAYHAIPVTKDHRKFLKFRWGGKLYHLYSIWAEYSAIFIYEIE